MRRWCCCCGAADDEEFESREPSRQYHSFSDRGYSFSNAATQLPPVLASDFEVLHLLGRGSYGRVLQVRKKDTRGLYAMKVLRKADVLKRNQARHAHTERRILQHVPHPFIVPLHYAFQSPTSLYLVMALQSGGDIFFHLRREGAFAESRARLYAAEIMLGLEALHTAGFVYRDLKPENVLLDAQGHVRLSDFGLAKETANADLEPASTAFERQTFCGTPSYMAPEMLLGTGHGVAVDWWSLGTLLFEMLSGSPPFYSRNLNTMYRSILYSDPQWPPSMSRPARSVLSALLQRDPQRRLGSKPGPRGGGSEVRRATFFRSLDFSRVLAKAYAPAFVPELVGASPSAQALDVANFDTTFTATPIRSSPSQVVHPEDVEPLTPTREIDPTADAKRAVAAGAPASDAPSNAPPPPSNALTPAARAAARTSARTPAEELSPAAPDADAPDGVPSEAFAGWVDYRADEL